MAQITGGLVSVEDSKPHSNDEYGRKKVRVDLSFAVGEGEDYTTTFDMASQAATNRVSALLNGTSLRVVGGENLAGNGLTDGDAAPPKRKRRTAAEIAEAGAKANGGSGGEPTSGDPASMEDPTGGEEPVIHLPDETPDSFDIEPEEPADESFDIEPAGADEEPVTDLDLNSAVQKKNAEIANPNAIRTLISGYNPDPKAAFQLRQIPAGKRREFLTKLSALTKAA